MTDSRNAQRKYITDVAAQIFIDAVGRDDLEEMVKLNREPENNQSYGEKLKQLSSMAMQAVVAGSMLHEACASYIAFVLDDTKEETT